MKPERDKDFEQYLNQLMRLLRKMMKHLPMQGELPGLMNGMPPVGKQNNASMNVFLFNFLPLLPVSAEEMSDLESLLEEHFPGESHEPELTDELNLSDLDFLRKNGIRF